jgi:hypothetical protein
VDIDISYYFECQFSIIKQPHRWCNGYSITHLIIEYLFYVVFIFIILITCIYNFHNFIPK